MAELLPDGISDLRDCPHTLFSALRIALLVISFDELDEGERPPKRIWLDGERMAQHFKDVRRRRAEKYGDKSAQIEDPVQNAAARDLIVD